MKILCAGAYPALQRSLHVGAWHAGAVNRIRAVGLTVAGKSVNTARALLRLGQDVVLTGFCGGSNGSLVRQLLEAEGLTGLSFVETQADVRICQTILPDGGGAFTELVEEGPALTDLEWDGLIGRCHDLLAEQAGLPVILSGTMPAHAPLDVYARVLEKRASGPVVLDTSGPALLETIKRHPVYVKINGSELFRSVGGDLATDEAGLLAAARVLLDAGARAVGITQGAGQAWLFTAAGVWRYRVPPVEVLSALGSGDCVNAGFMVGLLAGEDLPNAFARGLACGTANAESASPAQFDADRVQFLLNRVQMQQT